MGRKEIAPYIRDPAETLSPAERERLQVERLRACVARLEGRLPFYRNRLATAGVTAASITTLDDLERIPLTTKEDLRASYPFGLLAVPQREIVRFHASSGTTGKLTVVGYTRADLGLWAAMMARALAAAGVT